MISIGFSKLIGHCFENMKSSFVEYLILNNLCNDYSCVLTHCTKYPQTWKNESLKLLLNTEKISYDIFGDDSKIKENDTNSLTNNNLVSHFNARQDFNDNNTNAPKNLNCLHWCVNIGMEPLWIEKHIQSQGEEVYNHDSIIAAFEAFKLILECTNINDNDLNKLVNTRMADQIHMVEACTSNSMVHGEFIDYLIANNGKFGWKIDFSKTMMLQLACLVGNYDVLRKVTTEEGKIWQFGFEPVRI